MAALCGGPGRGRESLGGGLPGKMDTIRLSAAQEGAASVPEPQSLLYFLTREQKTLGRGFIPTPPSGCSEALRQGLPGPPSKVSRLGADQVGGHPVCNMINGAFQRRGSWKIYSEFITHHAQRPRGVWPGGSMLPAPRLEALLPEAPRLLAGPGRVRLCHLLPL